MCSRHAANCVIINYAHCPARTLSRAFGKVLITRSANTHRWLAASRATKSIDAVCARRYRIIFLWCVAAAVTSSSLSFMAQIGNCTRPAAANATRAIGSETRDRRDECVANAFHAIDRVACGARNDDNCNLQLKLGRKSHFPIFGVGSCEPAIFASSILVRNRLLIFGFCQTIFVVEVIFSACAET